MIVYESITLLHNLLETPVEFPVNNPQFQLGGTEK